MQIPVKQCQYFTLCGYKSPMLFGKGGTGHRGKDHVGCPMATEMFFLEVTQISFEIMCNCLSSIYLSSEQIGMLHASFKCSILSLGSLCLEARG